jgi:hypothetical protein
MKGRDDTILETRDIRRYVAIDFLAPGRDIIVDVVDEEVESGSVEGPDIVDGILEGYVVLAHDEGYDVV